MKQFIVLLSLIGFVYGVCSPIEKCNLTVNELFFAVDSYGNCTTNLATRTNDLTTCTNNFATCSNDLSVCSNDLSVCTNDLNTMANDFVTCTSNNIVCSNDLSICQIELYNHQHECNITIDEHMQTIAELRNNLSLCLTGGPYVGSTGSSGQGGSTGITLRLGDLPNIHETNELYYVLSGIIVGLTILLVISIFVIIVVSAIACRRRRPMRYTARADMPSEPEGIISVDTQQSWKSTDLGSVTATGPAMTEGRTRLSAV